MLALNSFISLAGSEEQINFSQQSPKILQMVSGGFIHALLLLLGLVLKISRLVAPDNAFKHTQNSKMICCGYFARYLKSPRRLEISPKRRGKHIGAIKAHSLLS